MSLIYARSMEVTMLSPDRVHDFALPGRAAIIASRPLGVSLASPLAVTLSRWAGACTDWLERRRAVRELRRQRAREGVERLWLRDRTRGKFNRADGTERHDDANRLGGPAGALRSGHGRERGGDHDRCKYPVHPVNPVQMRSGSQLALPALTVNIPL